MLSSQFSLIEENFFLDENKYFKEINYWMKKCLNIHKMFKIPHCCHLYLGSNYEIDQTLLWLKSFFQISKSSEFFYVDVY